MKSNIDYNEKCRNIYKCDVFSDPDFVLLLKDGSIVPYRHDRKDFKNEHYMFSSSLDEINYFLESQYNDIDCIFSDILNFNLKSENICFCYRGEVRNFYLDESYNKDAKSTCYIGFLHSPFTFNLSYENNFKTYKFLHNSLSFYGRFSLDHISDISYIDQRQHINIDKLKKLKTFNKVLWVGHPGRGLRSKLLNTLQQELNIKIVESTQKIPKVQSFIDALIENECFCALSLDGSTVQCFRDTYLGVEYVPNFKYTNLKCADFTAGNTIYLATNTQEAVSQLQLIKQDLTNENYNKLIKNNKFMMNAASLYRRKFLNDFVTMALVYKNINIENLILHPLSSELTTKDEWNALLSNVNNLKDLKQDVE